MKKQISTAAIKRIITAQKVSGFVNWKLNFSKAQAKQEGLTDAQVDAAFKEFCDCHGAITTKSEMVEAVYAAICTC